MREQSPNHSDPIPNAENWILASDPFERPKIYRHKHALFMAGEQCGVFVYVIRAPKQAPIILQDIGELQMNDNIFRGGHFSLYSPPVLRLIINGEPVEIGKAFPIINERDEAFITIPDVFIRSADIKRVDCLRNLKEETAFRMKVEGKVNPAYQDVNPQTFRGTLNPDATLAIRQAVDLYDYFQGTP